MELQETVDRMELFMMFKMFRNVTEKLGSKQQCHAVEWEEFGLELDALDITEFHYWKQTQAQCIRDATDRQDASP